MRINVYDCNFEKLSREQIEKALNAPHIQQLLKTDMFYGCLCPAINTSNMLDIVTIKMDEASHKLSDFKFEGDRLFATVTPLDTKNGRILANYMDGNCRFSARALANRAGTHTHLVTFDVVELNTKKEE